MTPLNPGPPFIYLKLEHYRKGETNNTYRIKDALTGYTLMLVDDANLDALHQQHQNLVSKGPPDE